MPDSEKFYSDLPVLALPPVELLAHRQYFHLLPRDWSVVVTDVKDSTGASRQGQYRQVNLLASATVVVALNLAKRRRSDIPFVYGGDGATTVVPPSMLDDLLEELAALRQLAARKFNLELRVGALTIADIETAGHLLKVAKILLAPGYEQSFFLDDGLFYAEQLIKDNPTYQSPAPVGLPDGLPQLKGLQCRWSDIAAPADTEEVVCFIVCATDPARHDAVYREVIGKIEEIYGDWVARHPLRRHNLQSSLSLRPLMLESYARFGRLKPLYLAKQIVGVLVRRFFGGGTYQDRIIAAADILKIDGTLKMVMAGTPRKREELLQFLRKQEAAGELIFGHFVAPASVLTCFVPQANQYINFLDASSGGYMEAAAELKQKRQTLNPPPVVSHITF